MIKKSNKQILSDLSNGHVVEDIATGNSMCPLLNEGDVYYIYPASDQILNIDDIVFVEIKHKFLTHKILNIYEGKYTISNIHNQIDGVVTRECIHGIISLTL